MKLPEEQWKTIEEFPDYEISNFGNCRNRKTGKEKNKGLRTHEKNIRFVFYFRKNGLKYVRRVGKLVAVYFVENPNNYHHVCYIDGNHENVSFMNLRWCRIPNGFFPAYERHKTFCRSEKELTERYEYGISLATKLYESVKNNTTVQFIFDNVPDICMKHIRARHLDEKEYIIEFVTDMFIERTEKKYAVISVENFVKNGILEYFKKQREKFKKVQYNENYHNKGGYDYDND